MTQDARNIKRIKFAMQKLKIANRLVTEAKRELQQAVEAATVAGHSGGDGEAKEPAA